MSTPQMNNRRFNKAFYWAVALLAAGCLILLLLDTFQGPRIRNVVFNGVDTVQDPGQRLVLEANQPLVSVQSSQVHITPYAPFSVTGTGETISIVFTGRLHYQTTYHVRITQVASQHKHTDVTVNYTFTTPDTDVYYIQRRYGPDADNPLRNKPTDELVQEALGSTVHKVIFSAPQIDAYTVLGPYIAISINNAAGNSQLYLLRVQNDTTTELALPGSGQVSQLQSSADHTTFGFRFTSDPIHSQRRYNDTLFAINTAFGNLRYVIDGFHGQPIQATNWQFAPDGTTVLAQTPSNQLVLFDTASQAQPITLGTYSSFTNFSYDGEYIAVSNNAQGMFLLNALHYTKTAVQAQLVSGSGQHLVSLHLLPNESGFIALVNTYRMRYVLLDRGNTQTVLYQTAASQTTSILGYNMSPNDQYAEVSIGNRNDSDKYPDNPQPLGVHTLLINAANGQVVQHIDGSEISWEQ
jgi:hypothetical protein